MKLMPGPALAHARGHRLLGEHRRDAEVLADVAQQLDRGQLADPVEVVLEDRERILVGEQVPELLADLGGPGDDRLGIVELAFLALAAGIADQAGAAAGEGDRRVAGELEAAQRDDDLQMADVKRARCRVVARVDADAAVAQGLGELVAGGDVGDQAAPFQVFQQVVRHGGPSYARPRG